MKRQKPKQNIEIDDLSNQLLNTSITEPKQKKSKDPTVKTIDNFYPKLKQIDQLKTDEKLNFSFDLNASGFEDENDDLDISFVVDKLVQKVPKLPDNVEKLGYRVVFNSSDNCGVEKSLDSYKNVVEDLQNDLLEIEPEEIFDSVLNCPQTRQIPLDQGEDATSDYSDISDNNNCHLESDTDVQMSSFFEINSREESDLFEKTFNKNFLSDDSSDTTLEFEIEDLDVLEGQVGKEDILEEKNIEVDAFEQSFEFTQTYVPLLERIKSKMNHN